MSFIIPTTERQSFSGEGDLQISIAHSRSPEGRPREFHSAANASQETLDRQEFTGDEKTFESLGFVNENADWIDFLTSDLVGVDAQATQNAPLKTFLDWNFECIIEPSAMEDGQFSQDDLPPQHDIATSSMRVVERLPDHQSTDVTLPALPLEDQELIKVDLFGHFKSVNREAFHKAADFYSRKTNRPETFIPEHVFHTFVELYFEHFVGNFDFIHPSALEAEGISWILYLAVAAIGSQFSTLREAPKFTTALQELFYDSVDANLPPTTPPKDLLAWAQIVLLRDICLVFGGGKRRQIKQQYSKNTLVTLCRFLTANAFDQTPRQSPVRIKDIGQEWRLWVALESKNRLLHAVYYFECLQFVFLQVRPSIELSDWSTSLPAEAALWKLRTATEWSQTTQRAHNRAATSKQHPQLLPPEPDTYLAKLRYIYIYVEEKLALERLNKWPIRQLLPHFNLQQLGLNNMLPAAEDTDLYHQVTACVQARLQTLYPQDLDDIVSFSSFSTDDAIFPLLSMLRHFSLRKLHSFSGWQASEDQVLTARLELSAWMKDQPVCSRRCLFLAVTVFSLLRSRTSFACYDPFAILVAALFIWTYDQLAPASIPLDEGIDLYPVLRLDRKLDWPEIHKWVNYGGAVRLHITGIGVLDGVASPLRTLHELKRVLSTRLGWPMMCSALADHAVEVIQGRRPKLR